MLHPMTCYMHRPSFLWILLAPHPPQNSANSAVSESNSCSPVALTRGASTRARQGTRFSGRFLVVGAIHDGADTRENASTAIQQHNHTATLAPNSDDQAWAVLMLARLSGEAISSGYGLRGSVLRRSRRFEPSGSELPRPGCKDRKPLSPYLGAHGVAATPPLWLVSCWPLPWSGLHGSVSKNKLPF